VIAHPRAAAKLRNNTYAAATGFAIAQEYIDVETAKQTGRAAFGEIVAYLKAHPSVRVMLVEKTDRLYRNLKDW
jgi:site-specific DNA recombinase